MPLTKVQVTETRVQSKDNQTQTKKSGFEGCSAVAQIIICQYLKKWDVVQLSLVSKTIQKVAENDQIWTDLFRQTFPHRHLLLRSLAGLQEVPQISPKQQYRNVMQYKVSYNFSNGKCASWTFQAHSGPVVAMKCYDDLLFSASNGEVKVWRDHAGRYELVQTLKVRESKCLDFHDGLLLVGTFNEVVVFHKKEEKLEVLECLSCEFFHKMIVFKDHLFVADHKGIKVYLKKENGYKLLQSLKSDKLTEKITTLIVTRSRFDTDSYPLVTDNCPTFFYFHEDCLYLGSEKKVIEIWEKKEGKFVKLPSWDVQFFKSSIESFSVRQGIFILKTVDSVHTFKKSEKGFVPSSRAWDNFHVIDLGNFKGYDVGQFKDSTIGIMRVKINCYDSPKCLFLTKGKISSMAFNDRFACLSYKAATQRGEEEQVLKGKITVLDFSAPTERIFQSAVDMLENDISKNEEIDVCHRLRNIPKRQLRELFKKLQTNLSISPADIESRFYRDPMGIEREDLIKALKGVLQDRKAASERTIDNEISSASANLPSSQSEIGG